MIETADTEGRGGAVFDTGAPVSASVRRKRKWGLIARIAAAGILGLLAVVAVGFVLFLTSISRYGTQQTVASADAIVVLTGGYQRVDEAFRLLEEKKGKRLLISGVNPSTSRYVLQETFAADEARFACCVDVDREALDTIGNAIETARWAEGHGFKSVIVVTNDYHMPRSLLELSRTMVDVELIPHAVVAGPRETAGTRNHADRYRVLFGEYAKYAAARLRTLVDAVGDGAHTQKAALSSGG
jgi:uncharacterized SAM-binding protein YcdF (DUF218 family)